MAEYYKKKQPSCTTPDGREWFASGGGNTNPEYIEREAVMDKCGWYNTVNGKSVCAVRKDELASIPAADVVPVVRCKDCEHCAWYTKVYERTGEQSVEYWCTKGKGRAVSVEPTHFCSYGERKDGEGYAAW